METKYSKLQERRRNIKKKHDRRASRHLKTTHSIDWFTKKEQEDLIGKPGATE